MAEDPPTNGTRGRRKGETGGINRRSPGSGWSLGDSDVTKPNTVVGASQ